MDTMETTCVARPWRRRTLRTDTASVRGRLGEALTIARRRAGLSQGEMAALAGVAQSALSRLETGQSSITCEHLPTLIEILEVFGSKAAADAFREAILKEIGL